MEMRIPDGFSSTYEQARGKFLAAAQASGAALQEHILPGHHGLCGEALATDVAWLGREDADKLLIVTSGIHGVEGYCGSGCQIALLNDDALLARARELDIAVALVHAVNPHGFSYGRRVNEDNVDVNRNFMPVVGCLPVNPDYRELAPLLLPERWPPDEAAAEGLASFIRLKGEDAYGQALFRGQYDTPDGMFYGGDRPTWSNTTIRDILRTRAGKASQIGWIDLHTGLGPRGNCEKVFIGHHDELAVAKAWWGCDVISPVRPDSVMFEIHGPMVRAVREECPRARVATVALEFGTVSLLTMLDALRADHWCWKAGEPESSERRKAAREALRRAFLVEEDDWFGMVVGQFRTVITQTLLGLGSE